MKPVVIVSLFVILTISCQNNNIDKYNQIKTFNIEKLPEVTSLKLSDLRFIDIQYVPLETNQQSLIPRTINIGSLGDRIKFDSNSFIIQQFNNILKFRDDGLFVAKIGIAGRGPDEYQTCHDMETDEKGLIYIVDGWKRKLFIYSETGEFLKTVSFPLPGEVEFRFIEGAFLCYSQNNMGNVEYSFNLIDTGGQIIKKYPNKYPFALNPNSAVGFSHENLFYRFNGRLFKKEVYSDTIYVYENMKFNPYMIIKAGDRLITPGARSALSAMEVKKNYISPRNLFEFGDYVYYEFIYGFDFSNTLIYSFIASKKGNMQVLFKPEEGIINDLDGGVNILPLTIKDDNTIIGWVDAIKLKAHVASETFKNSSPKYPEKKKKLEKLANSLKETDNPVLVMVSLKK